MQSAEITPQETSNERLREAAGKGITSAVKYLLANGADLEGQDKKGLTALMNAAACGKTEMIKLLFVKGANLETTDKKNLTALIHAAKYFRRDAVATLLTLGAKKPPFSENIALEERKFIEETDARRIIYQQRSKKDSTLVLGDPSHG